MQAYKVVAEKISDSFSGIKKKATKISKERCRCRRTPMHD